MGEPTEIEDVTEYVLEVLAAIPEERPPLDGSIERPLSSPSLLLPSRAEAVVLDEQPTLGRWVAVVAVGLLSVAALVAALL
jgi:hypothetical protein